MKITARDAISYMMVVKDNKILGVVLDIDLHTLEYTTLNFRDPVEARLHPEDHIKPGEDYTEERGIADLLIIGPVENVVQFAEKYKKGEV